MEQINTVIEQWHERIGPLQQKAVETRGAYMAASSKIEDLKTPVPEGGIAARTGGYLRKAFGYAFRAPVLLYKQELAKLDMQREQFTLDSFITDTTSRLCAEITPALAKTAPQEAEKITALQDALSAGLTARKKSDYAIISCEQAANNIQWANNKYYFNALQRCQNSARSLRDTSEALKEFNIRLEKADFASTSAAQLKNFDDVADVEFGKFGPEFSGTNNAKFNAARRRLSDQRAEMSQSIDNLRTDLLDSLSAAADKLGIRTKAFDSLITAAHQRIKPAAPTVSGAAPKSDF